MRRFVRPERLQPRWVTPNIAGMTPIDTSITIAKTAQNVQKAVMARLLSSVEQAGQAQVPRRDTVQLSPQAVALYTAGG
jgi:hypothetical protein